MLGIVTTLESLEMRFDHLQTLLNIENAHVTQALEDGKLAANYMLSLWRVFLTDERSRWTH